MTAPPRLQVHIGDYLKNTPAISRVTWEHHGIYLLALFIAWNVPGVRLPNDSRWLALRFGCTDEELQQHVMPVVQSYFKLVRAFWYQKRLSEEHEFVLSQSEKQRVRANQRWEKEKTICRDGAVAMPPHNRGNATSRNAPTPTPTPTQQEVTRRARATRWPPDAVIEEEWLGRGAAARTEHGLPEIDLRLEAEKFTNYWSSKSGAGATKVDWCRTWVNWALSSKGQNNGQGTGPQKRPAINQHLAGLASLHSRSRTGEESS